MDNDNKISALITSETAVFNEKAHKELFDERIKFTLESEFGKTKKNHTLVTPVLILATIAVIAISIFVITKITESGSRNLPMDLNAFQSENIKDFLEAIKKNQAALDAAKSELAAIETSYALAVAKIEQELGFSLELNGSLKLSARELASRNRKAEQEAEKKALALKEEYEPKMAEKRVFIEGIEKRMAETDSAALATAEKQGELLDSKSKLYELETGKLREFYEGRIKELMDAQALERKELERQKDELARALKERYEKEIAELIARYNPTFDDERTAGLLMKGVGSFGAPFVREYPESYAAEALGSAAEYAGILKMIDDYLFLSKKMRSVEYINSVPLALASIEALSYDALLGFQRLMDATADRIAEKRAAMDLMQRTIGWFSFAVGEYASRMGAQGLILDTSDSTRIGIFAAPGFKPKDGGRAAVVRDGVQIATLALTVKGEEVMGRLLDSSKTLAAFDVLTFK